MANVPGVIYRCENDEHWTMRLIGEEIERVTGYPASDFIDNAERTFASVVHPEDVAEVTRLIDEAIAEDRSYELEYRLVRSDGEVRWILERGQLAHDASGDSWLDGVIFDITERRRAQDEARRAEIEAARITELEASRKRIVEASDRARRALERDLHDGAQQRLVSAALTLRMAAGKVDPAGEIGKLLDEAREQIDAGLSELRDLARGIHPAVLSDAGLVAAIDSLASRSNIPVKVTGRLDRRLPPVVESALYFTVAEALTNITKYAGASEAFVHVSTGSGHTIVTVRDNGRGGADPAGGSGLRGLADRLAALNGTLTLEVPPSGGTLVRAIVPVG
jgi:PAS domain S-box-containing protein